MLNQLYKKNAFVSMAISRRRVLQTVSVIPLLIVGCGTHRSSLLHCCILSVARCDVIITVISVISALFLFVLLSSDAFSGRLITVLVGPSI